MNTFRRVFYITALSLAAMATFPSNAAQIVVGQVCPLSGLEANQGRAYGAGMQLYFDIVNKAGGVNGNTFTLVRKDDRGVPEETVAATKKMLAEEKPMVLAGYFGNSNVEDVVASGMLEKEKVSMVGYRITQIRPETPYLYTVRAGLQDEIDKFTEHIATVGIKRIGLLYEDGPGAAALVAAAEAAAKKANITLVAKASYPARTAQVSAAAEAMTKAAPQAIFMVATGAAAAGFIERYGRGGAQLFAHSGVDIEQLTKRLAEEQMQGVSIAQVTPSPYKISSRLSKEFLDAVTAKKDLEVPVSYAMMEGFITAKVIVEAVKRQGAKPTREGTLGALNAMDRFDLGGYAVGYKPNSRSGSKFVEMSIISGAGKIRQ
ncbi:MAG: ABC transporter substrate-binding protein [Pseudomonadota bacterium]